MPPKREINIDSFIAIFSNDRVIDAFTKALQPALSSLTTDIHKQLVNLSSEIAKRDNEIKDLKIENQRLKNVVQQHSVQIEALENYTRVDNIIVHGLPESFATTASSARNDVGDRADPTQEQQLQPQKEDIFATEKIFTEFCRNKLHIAVSPSDISICHRLPSRNTTAPRPVIVRFANRKMKSRILAQRNELKGSNIYMNEHLTKRTSDMFAKARKLVKDRVLLGAWTTNGRLTIKVQDGERVRTKTINHPDELAFSES